MALRRLAIGQGVTYLDPQTPPCDTLFTSQQPARDRDKDVLARRFSFLKEFLMQQSTPSEKTYCEPYDQTLKTPLGTPDT